MSSEGTARRARWGWAPLLFCLGLPTAAAAQGAAISVSLAEATLVDQRGSSRRFPSEVLGEDLVVMDFVFTRCTSICPVLSGLLAGVDRGLKGQSGVRLVTLTLDPVADSPAKLSAYARRLSASRRWSWLTGPVPEVRRVLEGLGAFSGGVVNHAPLVLVGDAGQGRWYRFNGFPPPELLLAKLEELRVARGRSGQR